VEKQTRLDGKKCQIGGEKGQNDKGTKRWTLSPPYLAKKIQKYLFDLLNKFFTYEKS
jgi:hypothetical protein